MTYKVILYIAICIFAIPTFAQDTLTLNEAIRITLENNYGIRISKNEAQIAENNATKGNAGMLPRVDLNGGADYGNKNTQQEFGGGFPAISQTGVESTNLNGAISLTYTFFDGGAMFHRYNQLKAVQELSDIELKYVIENTLALLLSTYFEAARLQDNYASLQKTLALSQERLQRLEISKEYGNASTLDILNAEVDYNTDTSNLLNTGIQLDNAKRNLNQIMARDGDITFKLKDNFELDSLETLESVKQATEMNNKQLSIAEKNKLISQYDLKLAKAARYPLLSLESAYSYNKSTSGAGILLSNRTNGLDLGVTATFNLFDGNKKNTQIQNAELNVENSELRYLESEQQIMIDLENAYQNYEIALALLQLEENSVKTAQTNFDLSKERYQHGKITSTQLREAQLNLTNAETRRNNTLFAAKIAETELNRISGKLLSLQKEIK